MDQAPSPDETPAQRALGDLRAAVGFLTRLPVGAPHYDLARACWAFPIAGLIVGGAAGAVYALALQLALPALAAALLAILAATALTGALHEDGLADMADGLGGSEPGQRLEIMRDSRIGVFGVLALLFSVGLRAAALSGFAEMAAGVLALVTAAVLSRGALPAMMHALPSASESGLAAAAGKPDRRKALLAAGLAGAAAILALGPGLGIPAILAAALATAAAAWLAMRMIGGYNGDTLGGAQQCAETAVLLLLVAAQ